MLAARCLRPNNLHFPPALDQICNRLAQCVIGYPSDLLNLQVEIRRRPNRRFCNDADPTELDDGGNSVVRNMCLLWRKKSAPRIIPLCRAAYAP